MKDIMDIDDLKEVMEEKDIEKLDEFEHFGYKTTSNFGGMVIRTNSTGETVFVQEIWNSGHKEIEECRIEYDDKCEWVEGDELIPYFEYKDDKYYLNEFMRNNFGEI